MSGPNKRHRLLRQPRTVPCGVMSKTAYELFSSWATDPPPGVG